MGAIAVVGGGVAGLFTGMLLAKDGHDVVVLERDGAPPPAPGSAWEDWERRGVNQFRLPHFLLPRLREVWDAEAPELVDGLRAAGAACFNLLGPNRDLVPIGARLDTVTCRRPIVEAVIAAAAASTPNLEVRRGVGVAGLVTGAEAVAGTPNVVGVRTETGEVVPADLVVVAGGRRSPFDRWLAEVGARPAQLEEEDSGFVYYGRHVRLPDGAPFLPPGMTRCGSVSLLALLGDNGTCGVGIIATSDDAALRPLKDAEVWDRVMRALPNGTLLADESTPISDNVTMARLEDRWHRFVVDGTPVVTGAVAVADAWACTSPVVGRGITMGVLHAVALRDTVRDVGLEPAGLAVAFDEVTEEWFTPWYRSTLWQDRHTLAVHREGRNGPVPLPTGDELWDDFLRLFAVQREEPSLAVRLLGSAMLLDERPEEMLRDPEVHARLARVELRTEPDPGPSRRDLLALVAG
jgi:2-polyprenyl-6-methoxyphenol hydroxylase-like FAD-dependent oxidoreductase